MVTFVPHNELMESDPLQRDKFFWACYGIEPAQLERKIDFTLRDVFFAASLIYQRCLTRQMPKHSALAQITITNIAALLGPWENPSREVSEVSRTIRKAFFGDDILNHTNEIRRMTFENYHHKPFRVNAQQAASRWGISYSDGDLQRGVKIPYILGARELFLFGVYFAVGWFDSGRDRFVLGTTKKNRVLIKQRVIPLIYELFNIEPGTNDRERTSQATGQDTYESLDIYIDSKAHASFLRKHFRFYTAKDGEQRIYQLPKKWPNLEGMSLHDAMTYFLAGAIAAKGRIGKYRYDGSPELSFQHVNENYLESLAEAAHTAGFTPNTEAKGQATKLAFRKGTLDSMLTIDLAQSLLFDPMRGLFVNPVHLERLATYKPEY
ncbi:hypothetical protein HYV81_05280 [Candidatus Woesearchaeota archaeon]|nr:hypothetical protein [Candidatus Woesearchaeota archaeon]